MADDVTITAQNILDKLQLQTGEISTASLTLYKAQADSWGALVLSENSSSVDSLSDDQAVIFEAAKIAFAASLAVSPSPLNVSAWQAGPFQSKGITAKDLKEAKEGFIEEYIRLLGLLGFCEVIPSISYSGGDDYTADGNDDTNIDFSETEDYPFNTQAS